MCLFFVFFCFDKTAITSFCKHLHTRNLIALHLKWKTLSLGYPRNTVLILLLRIVVSKLSVTKNDKKIYSFIITCFEKVAIYWIATICSSAHYSVIVFFLTSCISVSQVLCHRVLSNFSMYASHNLYCCHSGVFMLI